MKLLARVSLILLALAVAFPPGLIAPDGGTGGAAALGPAAANLAARDAGQAGPPRSKSKLKSTATSREKARRCL